MQSQPRINVNRPHFHIGGIPVRIEPAFLIVIAILGIDPYDLRPFRIVSWVIVVTVSVMLHELGHAIAFKIFGLDPRISLYGMGGLTSAEGVMSSGRHIVVSLAGPLSALVILGLPTWWLSAGGDFSGDTRLVLSQLLWVNIGWSLLNLMPVLPLDGGHVLEAVLEIVTGGSGRRPARIVSVVVAAGLGLWALQSGLMFGAVLAAMFAGVNVSQLATDKESELTERLETAQRALLHHMPDEAAIIVDEVLGKKPSGATLRWAAEMAGWVRLWQGDLSGAAAVVDRYAHAGKPSTTFVAAEALAAGRIDEGVAVMAWAFINDPTGPAKILGAVAAAGINRADAVAREMMATGGNEGVEATRLFAALLNYAGYHADAQRVNKILHTQR